MNTEIVGSCLCRNGRLPKSQYNSQLLKRGFLSHNFLKNKHLFYIAMLSIILFVSLQLKTLIFLLLYYSTFVSSSSVGESNLPPTVCNFFIPLTSSVCEKDNSRRNDHHLFLYYMHIRTIKSMSEQINLFWILNSRSNFSFLIHKNIHSLCSVLFPGLHSFSNLIIY